MAGNRAPCVLCDKSLFEARMLPYKRLKSHVDDRHQVPVKHDVCKKCLGIIPIRLMKLHKRECPGRPNLQAGAEGEGAEGAEGAGAEGAGAEVAGAEDAGAEDAGADDAGAGVEGA